MAALGFHFGKDQFFFTFFSYQVKKKVIETYLYDKTSSKSRAVSGIFLGGD